MIFLSSSIHPSPVDHLHNFFPIPNHNFLPDQEDLLALRSPPPPLRNDDSEDSLSGPVNITSNNIKQHIIRSELGLGGSSPVKAASTVAKLEQFPDHEVNDAFRLYCLVYADSQFHTSCSSLLLIGCRPFRFGDFVGNDSSSLTWVRAS